MVSGREAYLSIDYGSKVHKFRSFLPQITVDMRREGRGNDTKIHQLGNMLDMMVNIHRIMVRGVFFTGLKTRHNSR